MTVPDLPAVEAYADKVWAALAERRALAQHALTTVDDQLLPIDPPTPWHDGPELYRRLQTSASRAYFIAANDPAHVLALLGEQGRQVNLAVEGLWRHDDGCLQCWDSSSWPRTTPCPDALAYWSVLTGIGATYGVTE